MESRAVPAWAESLIKYLGEKLGHQRDGRLPVQRVSRRTRVLDKEESTHGKRVRLAKASIVKTKKKFFFFFNGTITQNI